MRTSKSSISLVIIAVAFLAAAYLASQHSRMIEEQSQRDFVAKNGFSISDQPYDWTYWDVGSIAFLVLGSSSVVAAVRLAR